MATTSPRPAISNPRLYPPLVADLFRPLASLRYAAAKGLFTAAMLGAWVGAGLLVSHRESSERRRDRAVFFLASALYFPFYRHLERGHDHVGDRGPGLQNSGQPDDGHARLAGTLDERARGSDHDPPPSGVSAILR